MRHGGSGRDAFGLGDEAPGRLPRVDEVIGRTASRQHVPVAVALDDVDDARCARRAGAARRAPRRSTRTPPGRTRDRAARREPRPPTGRRAARGRRDPLSQPRRPRAAPPRRSPGTIDHSSGSASTIRSSSQPRGPDRREERGEVVGEVLFGRPAELVAADDPVGERQGLAQRDELVLRRPDEHHGSPQRVVGPRRRRGSPRAPTGTARPRSMASHTASRVEHQPDGARSTNGELANTAREQRSRACAQSASGESASRSGAEVDVHLDRRGLAHHRPARGSEPRRSGLPSRRSGASAPGGDGHRREAGRDRPGRCPRRASPSVSACASARIAEQASNPRRAGS